MNKHTIVTIPIEFCIYSSDIRRAVRRDDEDFAYWLFDVGPENSPSAEDLVEGIANFLHVNQTKESFLHDASHCVDQESADEYLDFVVGLYMYGPQDGPQDGAMKDYIEEYGTYQQSIDGCPD